MEREELIDEELRTKHHIDGMQMGEFYNNGFYNGFHLGVEWGDEHQLPTSDETILAIIAGYEAHKAESWNECLKHIREHLEKNGK